MENLDEIIEKLEKRDVTTREIILKKLYFRLIDPDLDKGRFNLDILEKINNILISFLLERDSSIRIWVTKILGELGNNEAIKLLIRCLKDEEEKVRETAVMALIKLEAIQAKDSILSYLIDEGKNHQRIIASKPKKITWAILLYYLISALIVGFLRITIIEDFIILFIILICLLPTLIALIFFVFWARERELYEYPTRPKYLNVLLSPSIETHLKDLLNLKSKHNTLIQHIKSRNKLINDEIQEKTTMGIEERNDWLKMATIIFIGLFIISLILISN